MRPATARCARKVVIACKRERARRLHTVTPAELAQLAKTDPSVLVVDDDMRRALPARLACPQRRPILHLPTHWPWSKAWLALWHNTPSDTAHHCGLPLAEQESQPAAHSLVRSSSSRPNRASSPGTIQAKADACGRPGACRTRPQFA
jgi:hypothetical protein